MRQKSRLPITNVSTTQNADASGRFMPDYRHKIAMMTCALESVVPIRTRPSSMTTLRALQFIMSKHIQTLVKVCDIIVFEWTSAGTRIRSWLWRKECFGCTRIALVSTSPPQCNYQSITTKRFFAFQRQDFMCLLF